MKNVLKAHPALAEAWDTLLSLLSGSFALPAVGWAWAKERLGRKNDRKG